MLTFNNRRNHGAKVARATALCLLALAAALLQPSAAQAQMIQPSQPQAEWTTNGNNITTTGNVGVGTTAPQTSVHVSTSTTSFVRGIINEQASADSNSALFFFRKSRAGAAVLNGDNLGSIFASPFDGTNFVNSARLRFAVDGAVATGSVPTAIQFMTGASADGTERMRISSAGYVGIGNTAPQSLLDITGSSGMTLRTTATSSGFSFFDRPSVPGDQVVFQGNKGNYSLFNVSTRGANIGTEKGSGMAFWTVDIANTANATQFQMHYAPQYGPIFFTQKFGTGAQGDKKISFQTAWQNTAVAPSQLVLDTSGYVGVGTATPVSRLHVAGDIRVDGNINAKYQDVAEWVPSVEKLSAGTVVILDVARDNHVAASSTSYDTRVAGVISAQPGISLGEAGEGKVLVATTGRVKVRVDATQAPIKVGDLLVTSDRQGFAMKSEPEQVGKRQMHAPGTIIGKALESLAGGTGEILVLLSLQ